MRNRARARLSSAVALMAASGLASGAVFAQTGTTSPMTSEAAPSTGAPATTGTATAGTEQNAAAAPATGTTGSAAGAAAPSGRQNAAAAPSTGTPATAGTPTAGTEQNAAAAPAGGAPAPTTPELRVEDVRAFIGKDVLGPNGNVLGTLANVITGPDGKPEQLVVSRGGFLGLFQSQYKVNWAAAKPKIENGKLVFALTSQDLTQTANK